VFAVLLFYIFTILGVFILRRKLPEVPRPYRAVGYPVLPLVYVAMIVLLCTILLIYKPQYTWPGFIIVALGVPAYYIFKSQGERNGNMDSDDVL